MKCNALRLSGRHMAEEAVDKQLAAVQIERRRNDDDDHCL